MYKFIDNAVECLKGLYNMCLVIKKKKLDYNFGATFNCIETHGIKIRLHDSQDWFYQFFKRNSGGEYFELDRNSILCLFSAGTLTLKDITKEFTTMEFKDYLGGEAITLYVQIIMD